MNSVEAVKTKESMYSFERFRISSRFAIQRSSNYWKSTSFIHF
jgi:hypothetical protein